MFTPFTTTLFVRSLGRANAAIAYSTTVRRHVSARLSPGIIARASAGAVRSHDTSSALELPGEISTPALVR